ncbi:MAG: hypothetical protein Q8Q23_05855 [bacterium]|nr:hypothetical protein [bacterium]
MEDLMTAPMPKNSSSLEKKSDSPEINSGQESQDKDLKKLKRIKQTTLTKKVWRGFALFIAFIIIVQIVVADKYDTQVLVIEGNRAVGVNPTTESLDFGDMSADKSVTRFINLQAAGVDTFISVWKFGSIAELIKLNKNNFTMKEGDSEKLEFSLYMPPSAPVGETYTGSVWIFKLPKQLW